MKTNAMRVLENEGVPYRLETYDLGEGDFSAEAVAQTLDLPAERVFKTLVIRGDLTGPMLALVPGGTELDLRLLARATGDKRIEMLPLKEVRPLTGYPRGAVTPLAIHKELPVYIDETVILWDQVGISAGAKGGEILLHPKDLIRVTGAVRADIARSA